MSKYKYGVITALITPFKNGKIDFLSFKNLVMSQLAAGVEGFVINGTTAESPTLDWPEVEQLLSAVKELVPKEFPIILGVGSNSTKKTIENAKRAEEVGVTSVLVVVPYYNKPPQRGLVEHFKAIAAAFSGDVVLYNVPGRTITALSLESIVELSKIKNIVAIKEASGNIEFAQQIRSQCHKDFKLLSGDDGTFWQFKKAGGDGIISVATHIFPEVFVKTQNGQMTEEKFNLFLPAINSLYLEANPIPVKMALKLNGIISSAELRLPLVEMDPSLAQQMSGELSKAGVL